MTTLTLTLDDNTAAKAQQWASKKHTTLDMLFTSLLSGLGYADDEAKSGASNDKAVSQLQQTFTAISRPLGGKGYTTRDELYER